MHIHWSQISSPELSQVLPPLLPGPAWELEIRGQPGQKAHETPSQPVAGHGGIC
jgi:hypothetical protein